ncbi:molybdenum cofactor guanylyltransferase MobA [Litorivivens sp.]|uniref:molybdenum cofactor guanylyltransferase MobA n=1 Tax=Litorivivens sp. TaxID=2020868 RepID=UPI00356B4D8F
MITQPFPLIDERRAVNRTTTSTVDAIILAGGQGARLGGRDKGLVDWEGRALIAHVIDRIAPQVASIVISANRNLLDYGQFGYPVYPDSRTGFNGPLAGIEACASHCSNPFTLIVACDTPKLPLTLVRDLKKTLDTFKVNATYATDERPHYLPCLVRTQYLTDISAQLNNSNGSVKGWLKGLGERATPFENCQAFVNMNYVPGSAAKPPPEK